MDSLYYQPLSGSDRLVVNRGHDTYLSPPPTNPVHPQWKPFRRANGSGMPKYLSMLWDEKEAKFWTRRIERRAGLKPLTAASLLARTPDRDQEMKPIGTGIVGVEPEVGEPAEVLTPRRVSPCLTGSSPTLLGTGPGNDNTGTHIPGGGYGNVENRGIVIETRMETGGLPRAVYPSGQGFTSAVPPTMLPPHYVYGRVPVQQFAVRKGCRLRPDEDAEEEEVTELEE